MLIESMDSKNPTFSISARRLVLPGTVTLNSELLLPLFSNIQLRGSMADTMSVESTYDHGMDPRRIRFFSLQFQFLLLR